jgi:microcompartment protein CcmL/EutN
MQTPSGVIQLEPEVRQRSLVVLQGPVDVTIAAAIWNGTRAAPATGRSYSQNVIVNPCR